MEYLVCILVGLVLLFHFLFRRYTALICTASAVTYWKKTGDGYHQVDNVRLAVAWISRLVKTVQKRMSSTRVVALVHRGASKALLSLSWPHIGHCLGDDPSRISLNMSAIILFVRVFTHLCARAPTSSDVYYIRAELRYKTDTVANQNSTLGVIWVNRSVYLRLSLDILLIRRDGATITWKPRVSKVGNGANSANVMIP